MSQSFSLVSSLCVGVFQSTPLNPLPPFPLFVSLSLSSSSSAIGLPLQNLGLSHKPPAAAVRSGLNPPRTRSHSLVIHPSCWWTNYAVLSDPRSSCYMVLSLPLQVANSLGYVGNASFTYLINSDISVFIYLYSRNKESARVIKQTLR